MNSEEFADILIEALEVFLNHILYVRDLYPQQIFKKRRVYNAPVYISIFPPLNAYLLNVLRAARELQQRGELHSVQLLFYHEELPLDECYIFNFNDSQQIVAASSQHSNKRQPTLIKNDKYLIEFEEQLRSSLYNVAERLKPLEKLPKGSKFKICLNTTQEAFVRFGHDAHYQDFPWICDVFQTKPVSREISILPLSTLNTLGLKINLELA